VATMTLSELRSMTRSLISYDLEGAAATDADLNALINRSYQQHAARVGAAQMAQVSVSANQAEVSVPGLMRLDRCWWKESSGATYPMQPAPADWLHRFGFGATGTPRFYHLDGNILHLYPAPAQAGSLLIEAVSSPVSLANNSDTPYTPSHLHPAIAYRAAGEWALRYNHAKAQAFLAMAQEIESVGRTERFGNALHSLDGVPR
jgi:hypothetical protein